MKIRLFLLTALATTFITLTGCWDYMEYEDMALVFGMGIDYSAESDKMTVTIQYIESGSGAKQEARAGGSESSKLTSSIDLISSSTDITILDALDKLQRGTAKRLFFGYMNTLVISENAAKSILKDVIEFLYHTPDIRTTSNIFVTPGKAQDIISTISPGTAEVSGIRLNDLIKMSSFTGAAFQVTIHDFEQMLAIPGIEGQAPRITTSASDKQAVSGSQEGQSGKNMGALNFDIEKKGHTIVEGIACFKGEIFAGWLNDKESRGLGWITGKNIHSYISVSRSGKNDTREVLNFLITSSKSNIKGGIENSKPIFDINVKAEAELRKYSSKYPAVLTPDVVDNMEKELADVIRSDMESALEKGQKEYKTDIFGLGFAFFRKYPVIWRTQYKDKWDDIFPSVPIRINVEAHIPNTGNNADKFEVR